MRKQIVGGPSLDFSRYEKVNNFFIGGDENKLVKSIVGYDANALYQYAIGGNIHSGPYIVYEPNSGNRHQPHRHPFQMTEREFVCFSSKQHYNNSPSCVVTSGFSYSHTKIGNFFPKACCKPCRIVWEFMGSYHHAHSCLLNEVVY